MYIYSYRHVSRFISNKIYVPKEFGVEDTKKNLQRDYQKLSALKKRNKKKKRLLAARLTSTGILGDIC